MMLYSYPLVKTYLFIPTHRIFDAPLVILKSILNRYLHIW